MSNKRGFTGILSLLIVVFLGFILLMMAFSKYVGTPGGSDTYDAPIQKAEDARDTLQNRYR